MAAGPALPESARSAPTRSGEPTVVAIATGPASGGIGVLRLSGGWALDIARLICPTLPAAPTPRHAYLESFVDEEGRLLDRGLVLFFPAPNSYTGEDVVELQAHGSVRLLKGLLRLALADGRARLAEPGELSRRAFLNGRIDLSRAEAVADLVSADSEAAVRSAAAQLQGLLETRLRAVCEPLLRLRAEVEGVLDFPDEAGEGAAVRDRLEAVASLARGLREQSERGRLVRRGARVVLYGPVNAGKSTLFNRLLEEPRALVDEEPGTTRDLLEARLELRGLGVTLVDTAGLREGEAAGRLEAQGIARTRATLREADLAILVTPPGASADELLGWAEEAAAVPLLRVESKSDLGPGVASDGRVRVSGLTGAGVDGLLEGISTALGGGPNAEAIALTSDRHIDAVRRATAALERALAGGPGAALEGLAQELGIAASAFAEITGESASEALLDGVFARFCIGK